MLIPLAHITAASIAWHIACDKMLYHKAGHKMTKDPTLREEAFWLFKSHNKLTRSRRDLAQCGHSTDKITKVWIWVTYPRSRGDWAGTKIESPNPQSNHLFTTLWVLNKYWFSFSLRSRRKDRKDTVIYYCLFVFLNIKSLERQYPSSNVYFISPEHDVLLGKCVLWGDLS